MQYSMQSAPVKESPTLSVKVYISLLVTHTKCRSSNITAWKLICIGDLQTMVVLCLQKSGVSAVSFHKAYWSFMQHVHKSVRFK